MAVDDMTTSAHWQRMWDNKCDWTWGAADGAGSRLAPNGHTYWLWGDTIVGYPASSGTGFDAQRIMVSNSILIQRGAELGPATFGNGGAAVPNTVMDDIERRFWTTDILFPTVYPTKCFVLCQRIHDDVVNGFIPDGAMIAEFDILSTGMLKYTGRLHETPTTLVDELDELEIQWAQAMEEVGGYVYIYGFNTVGAEDGYFTPNRSYVARVAVRQLTNKYAWQFWTGAGWVAGSSATGMEKAKARSKDILDGQVTSVRYDPEGQRWLFANKPWSAFGSQVQIHSAPDPQGPLTLRNIISSPGGTSPGGNAYVTYNPTIHPRISLASGKLLVAISHNGDFFDIFDERNLYKPDWQEVTVPF